MDVVVEQWTEGGVDKAMDEWIWAYRPVFISHSAIWPWPWSLASYLAAIMSP